MINTDVLIVGGGPAGSACAWQLKKHNISCLILDKKTFPRFKPCAGWITPQVFRLLGIQPQEYPFSLTHFSSFQVTIKKYHFTLATHQYAIRRIEFDHWLLQRSEKELIHHQVRDIQQKDEQFILDNTYSAPILVGSGGTSCPVRRYLLPNHSSNKAAKIVALEEEFEYPYTDNRCHLWFMQNGLPGYGWYVPKANGYVNVGIGGKAEKLKAQGVSIKTHWQMLVDKIEKLRLVQNHKFHPLGHSYSLTHKHNILYDDGIYLIGDSAGLATKDMGEGIGPAIQSGILAANAISEHKAYTQKAIPRYSIPSLINLRK